MTERLQLKQARTTSGLARRKVAESLGISVAYYGMIEQGTRQPALDLAQRIAALFGSSVDALFGASGADRAA